MSRVDLPHFATGDPPLLSDQSLRGHWLMPGLPSGLPTAEAGGFPRYEPVSTASRETAGQVEYLPDKEFRWISYSVQPSGRHLLVSALPACRHADGTISSSSVLDVRRMASEDSEKLSSGLLAVHRRSDLDDLDQPPT